MKIRFKKLNPNAVIPTKAHATDAGFDLVSVEDVVVKAQCRYGVDTGIAIEVPIGYFGMVLGRSGNTMKKGIVGQTGIIDTGYYDAIKVMLFNTTTQDVTIHKGDRIGQILIVPHLPADFDESEEFTATNRGGGFGHSGGNIC